MNNTFHLKQNEGAAWKKIIKSGYFQAEQSQIIKT